MFLVRFQFRRFTNEYRTRMTNYYTLALTLPRKITGTLGPIRVVALRDQPLELEEIKVGRR